MIFVPMKIAKVQKLVSQDKDRIRIRYYHEFFDFKKDAHSEKIKSKISNRKLR